MSFLAWLLMGIGVYVLYSAYKGNNPLSSLADRFGIAHVSPTKLGGAA